MRSWRSEAADLLTAVAMVAVTAAACIAAGWVESRPRTPAAVEAGADATPAAMREAAP